ncbi:MAG: amino acid ABC transporter substrate-binding protein [Thermodesulfovibrionales bacterium]|nr:amino acid ABC transporter substrate-binding protein [Thermodesulfovibrionales bacterium]
MKRLNFIAISIVLLFPIFLRDASASEPIKIGLTLGLTGKYSEMSGMQIMGLRLWESNVNSRGGILGRKVQIIVYDDESDSKTAKALYEHLILKDKVNFVFSPYSSEITEAVLPITEKYAYPVLISGASADRLWQKGYRNVFGVFTPASNFTIGFLELLLMNNLDDIAVVFADDTFSLEIANGTKKWAKRFKLGIRLWETFKQGTTNLEEIAARVKTSGAHALILCGHFEEAVNMKLALKKIGWHPKAYFASAGSAMPAFYERLKSNANYTFSFSLWEHSTAFNGGREFYKDFIKTCRRPPSYEAAIIYAAAEILEAAIKKTNSLDKTKIRDTLSVMNTMTIIGMYGVDKTGMQIRQFNLIVQWQNGKKEVVWPDGLKTANPKFR